MRALSPLVAAAAVVLLAAGCGGSGEPTAADGPPAGTGPDDELSVSTAGWETDFSRHTVPLSEFLSGGPGKDGIPAIDAPVFVSVADAGAWIAEREPVVELEVGGAARAYPIQILVWHEIVNDTLAGTPVAVTFCPLCNTALVFDRRLDGRVLDFGTTGNLRNSDLVMYDRQTETWWQQFGGEGVVGELAGETLVQLPARIVAWEDFAARHPDGEVLSQETGFSRQYGRNPYAGYDDVDTGPFFPAAGGDDDRLSPKERVVFLERGGEAVAVPFPLLEREGVVEVEVGGETLAVEWVPGVGTALEAPFTAGGREVGSATVTAADGEPFPFDTPFWFAVAAFRPDVRVLGPETASAGAVRPAEPPRRYRRVPGRASAS